MSASLGSTPPHEAPRRTTKGCALPCSTKTDRARKCCLSLTMFNDLEHINHSTLCLEDAFLIFGRWVFRAFQSYDPQKYRSYDALST
jgi:hypothetical protein